MSGFNTTNQTQIDPKAALAFTPSEFAKAVANGDQGKVEAFISGARAYAVAEACLSDNKTRNHESAPAFTPTLEMELYLRVSTCLIEPKFYTPKAKTRKVPLWDEHSTNANVGAKTDLEAIQDLVAGLCDTYAGKKFVLQLAVYARNTLQLRTIPQVLLVEVARVGNFGENDGQIAGNQRGKSKSLVRRFTPLIVSRADEPAQVIAYWLSSAGKPGFQGTKANFPNALRRGLEDRLAQFNEYELAKNDKGSANVKLRDVFQICHPKASSPQQQEMYRRAREQKLDTPETWETYISQHGASAETWNAIAPKMGIMALLRNLRNFVQHDAQDAIRIAIEKMRDPEIVQASKQLPFRWFSAYKALLGTGYELGRGGSWHLPSSRQLSDNLSDNLSSKLTSRDLLEAVSGALEISVANLPKWKGKVAIAVDLSGSMSTPLSKLGSVTMREVGALLGALAYHLCEEGAYVFGFGSSGALLESSRMNTVLKNTQDILSMQVGHCTEAWKIPRYLTTTNTYVDRLVVLSDMQCYRSGSGYGESPLSADVQVYRQLVNPNCRVYSIDLAGYGTSQFPENDPLTSLLGGWSERILGLIPAIEESADALSEIREVES